MLINDLYEAILLIKIKYISFRMTKILKYSTYPPKRPLIFFLRISNSIYHSPTFFRDLDIDEQFYSTFYFLKLCELPILIPTNCIILILPLFSCRKESPAET